MLSLSGTSEDSLIMHGTVCQSKLIVVAKSKFIILICIHLTGLLKTFTCSIYSVCRSKKYFYSRLRGWRQFFLHRQKLLDKL